MPQTPGAERRAKLKEIYWPRDKEWDGSGNGWFRAPRTVPLILALLSQKELTGGRDVSRVYLELLARHMDGGVIEIGNESDHAYAAGYTGARAVRTWHERMTLLQDLGFIKSKHVGNQRFKLVLVVDPIHAVVELRKQGRVQDPWWEAYLLRLRETKEAEAVLLGDLIGLSDTSSGGNKRRREMASATR